MFAPENSLLWRSIALWAPYCPFHQASQPSWSAILLCLPTIPPAIPRCSCCPACRSAQPALLPVLKPCPPMQRPGQSSFSWTGCLCECVVESLLHLLPLPNILCNPPPQKKKPSYIPPKYPTYSPPKPMYPLENPMWVSRYVGLWRGVHRIFWVVLALTALCPYFFGGTCSRGHALPALCAAGGS